MCILSKVGVDVFVAALVGHLGQQNFEACTARNGFSTPLSRWVELCCSQSSILRRRCCLLIIYIARLAHVVLHACGCWEQFRSQLRTWPQEQLPIRCVFIRLVISCQCDNLLSPLVLIRITTLTEVHVVRHKVILLLEWALVPLSSVLLLLF